MNDRTIQKKRRAAGIGSLRILHSKTSPRRKQRVAAGSANATDLGSEVPNLGVARALLVILALHVAAIAAIFVHNKVTDDDPVVLKSAVLDEPQALAARAVSESQSGVQQGEDYYFVLTGDTYEKIARSKGIEEGALKQLNNNVALRVGRILRLPTAGAVPVVARNEVVPTPRVVMDPPEAVEGEPVAGVARAMIVEEEPPAAEVMREEEAVRVTPRSDPSTMVAVRVDEPRTLGDSGQRYKVRSGDSIWGISRKYKVSQEAILEMNGIADARKLRVGMELKIPASN